MFVCYPFFAPELKVLTPFPDIYRGFGLTCRAVTNEDYGDTLLGVGKDVYALAAWLAGLAP